MNYTNNTPNTADTLAISEGEQGLGAAERLEARRARVRQAYAEVFHSEAGRMVLDSLKANFGWRSNIELPSYRVGMAHADMAFIEGQKEVVRHILSAIGHGRSTGSLGDALVGASSPKTD